MHINTMCIQSLLFTHIWYTFICGGGEEKIQTRRRKQNKPFITLFPERNPSNVPVCPLPAVVHRFSCFQSSWYQVILSCDCIASHRSGSFSSCYDWVTFDVWMAHLAPILTLELKTCVGKNRLMPAALLMLQLCRSLAEMK